jgi:hypothetical protein
VFYGYNKHHLPIKNKQENMQNHQDKLIIVSTITVHDDYNEQRITLEKGSFADLNYKNNEGTQDEVWHIHTDKNDSVYVPISLVNIGIKTYFDYYQEKFAHLDKTYSYFGQLYPTCYFTIEKNGEKLHYQKIDEFITSDGQKFNAVQSASALAKDYWIIDSEESYDHKDITYFEPDTRIEFNKFFNHDNEFFLPPNPIEVSEHFVKFPGMLEVIECFFKREPLTPELRKEFDDYKEYESEQSDRFASWEDIPYTEVKPLVEAEIREREHARIMAEIEREVSKFRQELIKQRFKR